MQLRVALDPKLKITADEFAEAWNLARESEPAGVEQAAGETFLSPEMAVVLISAAVSIPAGVITAFVTDLLKKKFIDKKAPKTSVTTITDGKGEPVLVIRQSEE